MNRRESEPRSRRAVFRLASILALLGVAVLLASGAEARSAANEWAGTWKSRNEPNGMLTLTQSGSSVTGTYFPTNSTVAHKIKGTVKGREFTGTFTYTAGDPPVQQGPFAVKWTMSDDLRFIRGFRYGSTPENKQYFDFERVGPPPSSTTPQKPPSSTTPGATPKNDTSLPRVQAFAPPGMVCSASSPPAARAYCSQKPASRIKLDMSVKDDSGRASVHVALYDGGELVGAGTRSRVVAKGKRFSWNARLRADLKGPLFFCVWAEDVAKNKSARAPRSSCKFISLVVDINLVSNTCGGEGWETVVAAENYFGNTSDYVEDATGHAYTVDFRDACNLHDAGYGGQTVYDKINKRNIDYHAWTRKRVDDKFLDDMQRLCRGQIPPSATTALGKCIRDGRRYAIVRTLGSQFFDYDLMTPGTQGSGHRH